ncbi:MAG: HmuY family protein [Pseudomonadota bacterium]
MKRDIRFFITALAMAALVGCSDSDSTATNDTGGTNDGGGNDAAQFSEITIDGSAGGFGAAPDNPANKFTYFNLERGEVVELTDAEALLSSDWDMGFKRTAIKFNGGFSAGGSVGSAVLDNQDEYYNADGSANTSVFLNRVAADEVAALTAATADGATFVEDEAKPGIPSDGSDTSWWTYDPATRTVRPNNQAWFAVRGADGRSFAKGRVTAIDTPSRTVTIELFIQSADAAAFSTTATTWVADIDDAGGIACYDFDTSAAVDCVSGDGQWDLRLEISSNAREWTLWTNGGAYGSGREGGSLGGMTPDQAERIVASGDVFRYAADSVGNAASDSSWYAYNLEGNNRLWPNYRVYGVQTGSGQYAFQVVSYYNPDSGASGWFTIRHRRLN